MASARGSAYDEQIGFRRREGRDRNRIAGDKSVRRQRGKAVETVSVPECSRRSGFRVRESGNGVIARADSSRRAVGFFRSAGLQIETPDTNASTDEW